MVVLAGTAEANEAKARRPYASERIILQDQETRGRGSGSFSGGRLSNIVKVTDILYYGQHTATAHSQRCVRASNECFSSRAQDDPDLRTRQLIF
jgi:hypothetical protein